MDFGPKIIARDRRIKREIAWLDRVMSIVESRKNGDTWKKIAIDHNISPTRAKQLVNLAKRCVKYRENWLHKVIYGRWSL